MNATPYQPANRFLDRLSISQAAVEWQCLTVEQQGLVVVDGGMPYLAGQPDLSDRAAALLDAAQRGLISGVVHNEDGYPLRADSMRLDRSSVRQFIERVDLGHGQVAAPAESEDSLLRLNDVAARLGISRATLYRRIEAGEIAQAHESDPPRWRKSYVDSLVGGIAVDDDI